jgi:hypothetical protein
MVKSSGDLIPGSTSIGTSPAAQLAFTMLQALLNADRSPDIENNVDLSSSVAANVHSREESLISILNSHPWSSESNAAFNLANKHGQNFAFNFAIIVFSSLR